ncbi:MAG: hypothetical protein V7742_14055 [Halioglobus sp.]
MNLYFQRDPNAGPRLNPLPYAGFSLPVFNLLQTEESLLTLLLCLAVGLSFISGSLLLVAISVTALVIKIYPTVLLLLAFMAVAFFVVKNYWR